MPAGSTFVNGSTMTVITDPWQQWINCVNHTTTSATTDVVWRVWNSTANTASAVLYHDPAPVRRPPPVPTPEELARREQAHREARARAAVARALEERIAKEASERAELLLLAVLSPQQREQYQRSRWIIVKGRSGRLYRVRHGRSGNVDVLRPDGQVVDRLCAHPLVWMPNEDVMLSQVLHLQHDDAEFCRIANRHMVLTHEVVPGIQ